MKKYFIVTLILTFIFMISVHAKSFDYEEYNKLGISHAYIVGEYVFDLDHGYSPNLRDIMTASQSIPESEETTLWEITIDEDDNYFLKTEVYSWNESEDITTFGVFNLKYVYRSNLFSTNKDYDIL